MKNRELLQKNASKFNCLAFTVLAIDASAQKMGISPSEMRKKILQTQIEYTPYKCFSLNSSIRSSKIN